MINLGDIILSEIRQVEIDIQCLKYTGAKKVDLIEAENTLERKHWFHFQVLSTKIYLPQGQRASNKRQRQEIRG